MLVEDNELNRRLLNDFLEAHGYEVVSTKLGAAAVSLAREQRPAVILLDIQLPDISGMEAARRLKADAQTAAIPIVAVTAFAMRDDERRIKESGCDAYVSKPIHLSRLLEIIRDLTATR